MVEIWIHFWVQGKLREAWVKNCMSYCMYPDVCFIFAVPVVILFRAAYSLCVCAPHHSEHVVIPSDLRVTDIWCVLRHKSLLSGEIVPVSISYSM